MISAGLEHPLELEMHGLTVRPIHLESTVSKFPLSFDFREREDGGLQVAIAFNRDLFLPGRIARMQQHLETLLRSVVKDPEELAGTLQLLPQEERETVVNTFNRSDAAFDSSATVFELFERNAATHPHAVATRCEGREWSYSDLNVRANGIAQKLRLKRSIGPGKSLAFECSDPIG